MALKLKKSSLPWPLSTGQKEYGQDNGVMRQNCVVHLWKQVRGPEKDGISGWWS